MSLNPQPANRSPAITPGNRLASLIIAAVLSAVAVIAIWNARDFPSTGLATDIGAARFPIAYGVVLILLCGLLVIDTLRRPVVVASDALSRDVQARQIRNVVGGIVLVVVSALSINWIGYLPATFLYLALAMAAMGFRHPLWTPLIAALLTACLYGAFSIGLHVPLPVGSLFE